jgi:hypothetical protein
MVQVNVQNVMEVKVDFHTFVVHAMAQENVLDVMGQV